MSDDKHDWVAAWLENIEELTPSKNDKPLVDFYYPPELRKMGITCGENTIVHKSTNIVAPEKLVLGSNVRIDGFSLISCGVGITISNFVHIASHCVLMGGAGIYVGDYASIASGAKIFSVSDDVNGRGLVGPCVPIEKRHLHSGKVTICNHAVLAASSIVMPGSCLSKGSTLMPFSVLSNRKDISPPQFAVYSESPAVYIKDKKPEFRKLVEETE